MTKHIHTFRPEERFVSMIEFKGRLLVASERSVYMLKDDKLVRLEVVSEIPAHVEITGSAGPLTLDTPRPGASPANAIDQEPEPVPETFTEAFAKAGVIMSSPEPGPARSTWKRTPPPILTGAAWAEARGWKRVRGRTPAGAEFKTFGGEKMWRPRR